METKKCSESGEEENDDYENIDKWRYSIYTAIVFLLIANPLTYRLVNKILQTFVITADKYGSPTMSGLLIHASVFTLIIRIMMEMDI